MFKRNYELQSPPKRSQGQFSFAAWGSGRSSGAGVASGGEEEAKGSIGAGSRRRRMLGPSAKRSGFANSGLRYASPLHRDTRPTEALITRAELVEELSNLDIDQPTLRCCSCCHRRAVGCARRYIPLFRPTRVSSLFWMEKLMLFVDTMQLYALLWATSLAWPWPRAWTNWSSWTIYLNIDTVSLEQYEFLTLHTGGAIQVPRSPHGQVYSSFLVYWLAWVLAVVAVPVAYLVGRRVLQSMSADWAQFRAHLWNACAFAVIILYLPAQLALGRAFRCDTFSGETESRLAVDADVKCFSTLHIITIAGSALLFVAMLAFARWLHTDIRSHVLYGTPALHEKYLRWKEAEYVHGLQQEWLESGLWVMSSFRLRHAYYHPRRMVFKTVLVLLHFLLRDYKEVQIDVMFLLFLAWAAWETIAPAFRCGSTMLMSIVIHWVLVANAVGGGIRAHNMRTPLNVDSNFLIAMASLNGAAAVAFVVVCVVCAVSRGVHWPYPSAATATARSMSTKEREQRHMRLRATTKVLPAASVTAADEVVRHRLVAEEQEMAWVSALLRARVEMSQAQLGLPELVDIRRLDSTVEQLREMWREAKSAGSVMTWSLVETMDEVSALAEACRPVSYLPNANLSQLMPSLVARLRRRADRLSLVSPQKRRIFLKLLAFRSWIGDRVFERVEMGLSRGTSVRYYFNPFSVELVPPTTGAVSAMQAPELLRQMPAILRARPTGHPKVTTVAASKYEKSVALMRAVQRQWANLLLEYERSFNVQDPAMRTRLREPTEVAAWYAAARQINGIVRTIDGVEAGRVEALQPSAAEFKP